MLGKYFFNNNNNVKGKWMYGCLGLAGGGRARPRRRWEARAVGVGGGQSTRTLTGDNKGGGAALPGAWWHE